MERRLAFALLVSALLHATALYLVSDAARLWRRTSPLGWSDSIALQAVLRGPETPPEIEPPSVISAVAEVVKDEPPPPPPPEPPKPKETGVVGAGQTAALPAPVVAPGTPDPPITTTIGTVLDAGKYGERYALMLAQRFPDRVARRPELLGSPIVTYPRAALDARMQARVAALLMIDAHGNIAETTLIPDDPVFGPAVRETLKTSDFMPAQMDGKPVSYWMVLEFGFAIRATPAR